MSSSTGVPRSHDELWPDATPLPPHQSNCAGCGPANPGSPSLRTFLSGDRVVAQVEFDDRQEGAPGLAHGGAVATVLDDVLGTVLLAHRRPAVTARLTVNYVRPVVLGRQLQAEAWLVGFEGRKARVAGFLVDASSVVAEAEALFVCVPAAHFEAAGGAVPAEWRAMWSLAGGEGDTLGAGV